MGNRGRKEQAALEQKLLMAQFANQTQQNAATAEMQAKADADAQAARQKVADEETAMQDAIRKKGATPLNRATVLTSPFGLVNNANVARGRFLSTA